MNTDDYVNSHTHSSTGKVHVYSTAQELPPNTVRMLITVGNGFLYHPFWWVEYIGSRYVTHTLDKAPTRKGTRRGATPFRRNTYACIVKLG